MTLELHDWSKRPQIQVIFVIRNFICFAEEITWKIWHFIDQLCETWSVGNIEIAAVLITERCHVHWAVIIWIQTFEMLLKNIQQFWGQKWCKFECNISFCSLEILLLTKQHFCYIFSLHFGNSTAVNGASHPFSLELLKQIIQIALLVLPLLSD